MKAVPFRIIKTIWNSIPTPLLWKWILSKDHECRQSASYHDVLQVQLHAYIYHAATEKCVADVFDKLTALLGLGLFRKIFPLILTDNGVEFKDVEALEYTSNGDHRTKLFYCDPQTQSPGS